MGHRRSVAALHDSPLGATADGVRWLLDHGADPDPVFADNGETPLHVVAASWDVRWRRSWPAAARTSRARVAMAARPTRWPS